MNLYFSSENWHLLFHKKVHKKAVDYRHFLYNLLTNDENLMKVAALFLIIYEKCNFTLTYKNVKLTEILDILTNNIEGFIYIKLGHLVVILGVQYSETKR